MLSREDNEALCRVGPGTVPRLANQCNRDIELQKKELMFGVPFVGNLRDPATAEARKSDSAVPIGWVPLAL